LGPSLLVSVATVGCNSGLVKPSLDSLYMVGK
jgi:hypothetical protein